MQNNTVTLSIFEDLIHWPLPPAEPTDAAATAFNVALDASLRDDSLLTAGGLEDLDEEPRERQQARYDAVRRLPALVQMMGSQWTKIELVPYLLRCIEEEDSQLSFAVGMSLIDLASSGSSCWKWATSSQDARTDRPLALNSILPVLMRMGASSDAGVRLFLVEVVIPILFYGVPLESTVDLCEWEEKYVKVRSCDRGGAEVDGESKINFETGASSHSHGNNNNTATTTTTTTSGGSAGVSGGPWDPFRINLYANRLRSAVSTYLRDLNEDDGEAGTPGEMMSSSYSKVVRLHDYTERSDRLEVFRARWSLFMGLMDSMLRSGCTAAVSAAIECIGNLFSCTSWSEHAERCDDSQEKASLFRSKEELIAFTFATTRLHVGRVIRNSAEKPFLDLMTLLMDYQLLVEGPEGRGSGWSQPSALSLLASRSRETLRLGCGGLSAAERSVWDLRIGPSVPPMHRVVQMSLLRSLSRFIDWANTSMPGKTGVTSDLMNGLSFFSLCDVLSNAVAASASYAASQKEELKGEKEDTCEKGGLAVDKNCDMALLPLPESDACRDFGIAEAVLDGVQCLLDELLRPHMVEVFLGQQGGCGSHHTLEKKKMQLLRLCSLYRDCVVHMAAFPSWKTRWMTTQRLPPLTGALVRLLRRVGTQDASDGPLLVEECVTFLCSLHLEQWTSAQEGDGLLKELVHDEEEEVRSVVALCAARVFCALGQGMLRLVFPRGVLKNLREKKSDTSHVDPVAFRNQQVDSNSLGVQKKAKNCKGLLSIESLTQQLPPLLDTIFHCCMSLLSDPEERVRSGAAAGLAALAHTLNTMVTVSGLHLHDLCKETWLHYLDHITAALMTLLNDNSPTVQLALVSELAALLASSATDMSGLAEVMGGHTQSEVAQLRKGALIASLRGLARHEVWRYRERYATVLSEMCVRFLAPNSLAAVESTSHVSRSVSTLEESLQGTQVVGGRPSGIMVVEDGLNPLHRFAKEELLPLLVDVLFDRVKVVRDMALDSLVKMCDRLSAAHLQLQVASSGSRSHKEGKNSYYRDKSNDGRKIMRSDGSRGGVWPRQHDDDVFINDTLWPLIINSPKAMATYLSRSSLLRIAVRLGVDKESILLPLFDHLGHDAVLNVRLVVAKELFGILSDMFDSRSSSAKREPKVVFTEQERNGVVLQLLRLLVEDKSADVRNEAAKALKFCF